MKIFLTIVLIFSSYGAYLALNSAAKAILRGNVSKTRYRKIRKDVSLKDKIELRYILPYAKLYKEALKKIIFFANICYINFLVTVVLGIAILLLKKIKIEFCWLMIFINWIFIDLPAVLFFFIKTYPGWSREYSHDWRYAIDGKEKRRSTPKKR